jgi:4-alpha-glucanotransferase
MPELTAEQRELAAAYGVAVEYEDWRHQVVTAPTETVIHVLDALGVDAADAEKARAALAAHRAAERERPVPPCVVLREGDLAEVEVRVQAPIEVRLDTEEGDQQSLECSERAGHACVTLPAGLPLGYHTLHVAGSDGTASTPVIVTPATLDLRTTLGEERVWGLTAQLYSVRSGASWGVGDLADLARLSSWAGAELTADFVLVNPLSAAEPVAPMEPSPYLPSSRMFGNPLYLRVEEIPEYAALPPAARATIDSLRQDVHRALDDRDTIDRDVAWTHKAAALRLVHHAPRSPERDAAYRAFVRREDTPLRDFATWNAIAELHGAEWDRWPDDLRRAESTAVAAFRSEHSDDVDFHSWLQWMLDAQLETAQRAAVSTGMRIGVMHDLAVGVHRYGADAWRLQHALAQRVSAGAPPDAFNQVGQDWSQPPWRPDRLADLGYAPFRDLIRRLLRHAGALRVDHIIGLFRLWWIPEGEPPDRGTYVRYDHEALIGILALEAQRAGGVAVGEDLGNVEPSAREFLAGRGIVGTSILWFERDRGGRPIPAEQWRELCLASVVTHDLPPTTGYLEGDHVELRHRLGLLTRPVAEERNADAADRQSWLDVLADAGLLAPGADVEETVIALHRYLARSPARMLGVALSDAVGDRRTQNQPGTHHEYPNWRVPLTGPAGEPMLLEDVMASPRVRRLAAAIRSELDARPVGRGGSP